MLTVLTGDPERKVQLRTPLIPRLGDYLQRLRDLGAACVATTASVSIRLASADPVVLVDTFLSPVCQS
jgi:hypothetical protein